jgi:Transposase domain (DUF772)
MCEEAHLNLAYRWFCRRVLDREVPDHSTFSKNRHGRFRDCDLLRKAARLAAHRFGYSSTEANLMRSLSMPQVAATLAAALGAKNSRGQRLIDEPVLNTIIVLMVVSSILGPVLADLFGRRLALVQPPLPERADIIPIPSPTAALAGDVDKG